jgi:uridine kinase
MRGSARIIAIAGPSGSGKTELTRRLVRRLAGESPVVVPLDAYYRGFERLEPDARAAQNFDHPRAVDHTLLIDQMRALAGGAAVEMPVYDYVSHTRRSTGHRIGPSDVIIIEGLFALYWKDIRDLSTLRVFLDADPALCLVRRLERDTRQRGRSADAVRHQFQKTVVPMFERHVAPTRRFADLILQGDQPAEILADRVIQASRDLG